MKIKTFIKNLLWPSKENNFQPRILNDRAITLFILLFLLSKVFFSFELILIQQSKLFAELNAQKIIALTNEVRQQYGLTPLKENTLLDLAAQQKAQDMTINNYFAHFSPTGVSPWYWFQKAGYNYYYAGENLAMNFLDSEEVVRAWLNSPSHRDNILNQHYQEIGIAILPANANSQGIANKPIVVQLFGSPQVAKAATPAIPSVPTTKQATTTSKPASKNQEILGEEEKATTSTTIITITTIPPTTIPPATIPPTTLETPIAANLGSDTRTKINTTNVIIALSLIAMGSIVILGIIKQQRAIPFGYSEIVLRSAIVIFIGAAFWIFHLEKFIGQLMIS
ncbi:MAG: CAP domain-containing protein [Parcubacteria group bacterium]|nr:CAP domain-containing protein [Parcubacteria group bacterium]